jgi:hypothetical protein
MILVCCSQSRLSESRLCAGKDIELKWSARNDVDEVFFLVLGRDGRMMDVREEGKESMRWDEEEGSTEREARNRAEARNTNGWAKKKLLLGAVLCVALLICSPI